MKRLACSAAAMLLGLSFAVAASAESMAKDQYKAMGKTIDGDYKTAKAACASLAGNAQDICQAEAKGRKNVAQAELEFSYKPTVKTRYATRMARADADYAVANERCDDKAGNDKSVCVKEAKAAKVHAQADAKANMKTALANTQANGKVADANITAMDKTADARQDAKADKRKADYALARVKCDGLAGNAKDMCMTEAKQRFGSN